MIQVKRDPPPPLLQRNQAVWTERWRTIHSGKARGDWATPAARRDIRAALISMFRGKCAFCEGLLGVTSFDEIEHYHPKSVYVERAFEWTNLMPSCRVCNGSKGDTDHRGALIKPDEEDPEPMFWLQPDTGHIEPHPSLDDAGRQRVAETIRICGLQRAALCEKRARAFLEVKRWLIRMQQGDEIAAHEWDVISHPRTEFKWVVRHALGQSGNPEVANADRSRYEAGA